MQSVAETASSRPPINFLWLELTNQCNLKCTHCYADSGPQGQKSILSARQYKELMSEAFALGCRCVQFIGGEPTLNRDLPALVRAASIMGYEFIEVFTNLTRLPEELLQCFIENKVHVATSVYGPTSECHDSVTLVKGSFDQTARNLRRVVQAGLPVRAGIVEMEQNAGKADSTIAFLREIGVHNVSSSRLRHFGRGAGSCDAKDMSELCGRCAGGTVCVSPAGTVSPCIMSKQWGVGSILENTLSEIAAGDSLHDTRQRIYKAVLGKPAKARASGHASCHPFYDAIANQEAQAVCTPGAGDGAFCEPGFRAVGDKSALAICPPMVTDRAACDPFYDVIVNKEAQAICVPGAGDGAFCEPGFSAVADKSALAICPPIVTDRAACDPFYDAIVNKEAQATCLPGAGDGAFCEPGFAAVADKSSLAICPPMVTDRAVCPPSVGDRQAVCPPSVSDRQAVCIPMVLETKSHSGSC